MGEVSYILESNPHPNLIRNSFCLLLKRKKKKLIRDSNPHLSFNRPLPTRQTDGIILDVGWYRQIFQEVLHKQCFERIQRWHSIGRHGEDKDDSDWVTDNDSVMSDDGESDEW